jgi:hypothetical protein
MRIAAALALVLAAGLVVLAGEAALHEAWLTAFLVWTGIAVGALGALAIGHLLREDWLDPVRAPLEAAARTVPLLLIAAVPLLAGLDLLYPWAGPSPTGMPAVRAAWLSPLPFGLRTVLGLVLWSVLAWWLTRPGAGKRRSAIVLALLLPSVTLAAQDWVLSRDPSWWGSLQGFAVWVEGLMAALALAALASLARGTMPEGASAAGEALERGLLALGLAAIWLWFVQFITVWMADLPREAAWYLRRSAGGWSWLMLGMAVPALLAGLALAAPPRYRPWRMAAVCLLLLLAHGANLWWVVRPDAPGAHPPVLLDAAVLAGLAGAWGLVVWRRLGSRAAQS